MIRFLVNGSIRMKLAPGQIVDTALILLNEVGIDELTTRRLAERLGVQQPALYWHFKNKRTLIDAMNAAILERGHTHRLPRQGQPWDDFVRENARSFRRALLAYRDGARVHAGTEPSEADLPGAEAQLRCLVDAGFPPSLAMHALIAIGNFVLGSVLERTGGRRTGARWPCIVRKAETLSATGRYHRLLFAGWRPGRNVRDRARRHHRRPPGQALPGQHGGPRVEACH